MKTLEYYPHPEAKEDEIELGNFTNDDFLRCGRRTKRLGYVAFDAHGKAMESVNDIYPIFVKKEEMIQAGYTLVEIPYKK
jgi:hypothetical protein